METLETQSAHEAPEVVEATEAAEAARGSGSWAVSAKVFFLYLAYWVLFTAVAAVMLALLTLALAGVPAGVMLGVFGVAVLVFRADFIITDLSGQMMLFGGFAGAFACAFAGLLAVKAGFMVSRLFIWVKRRCDRLRGW